LYAVGSFNPDHDAVMRIGSAASFVFGVNRRQAVDHHHLDLTGNKASGSIQTRTLLKKL
jgi:hypothetical protein